MKTNYQKLLDDTLKKLDGDKNNKPSLLLHACCAPCSSYVLEYLSEFFDITLYFYNPNISPASEYEFRKNELIRLVSEMGLSDRIPIIDEDYRPEDFYAIAKGLEAIPEGGERCFRCYHLRLSHTADRAKLGSYDYFTTTLSISPYKNAEWLNDIGQKEGERVGIPYLFSDFKKKNGYKRSCELSEKYSLYRQDFCGCIYSKLAKEAGK